MLTFLCWHSLCLYLSPTTSLKTMLVCLHPNNILKVKWIDSSLEILVQGSIHSTKYSRFLSNNSDELFPLHIRKAIIFILLTMGSFFIINHFFMKHSITTLRWTMVEPLHCCLICMQKCKARWTAWWWFSISSIIDPWIVLNHLPGYFCAKGLAWATHAWTSTTTIEATTTTVVLLYIVIHA